MKYLLLLMISVLSLLTNAQVRRAVRADSISSDAGSKDIKKASKRKEIIELNLSREQKGKLKELKKSNHAEKESIENDTMLSPAQKEQKIKQLRKRNVAGLNGILNTDQKEKFRKMRKNKLQQG